MKLKIHFEFLDIEPSASIVPVAALKIIAVEDVEDKKIFFDNCLKILTSFIEKKKHWKKYLIHS